jgi:hypothetical protein
MLQLSLVHPFLHIPPRIPEPATRSRKRDRLRPRRGVRTARYQRQAEHPHKCTRSGQDRCKLDYSDSP